MEKFYNEGKLKEIIISCGKNLSIDQVNDYSDLTQDFAYDSMNYIHLIAELEMEFNIEIDETEIDIIKLSKYKNLLDLINEKVEQ